MDEHFRKLQTGSVNASYYQTINQIITSFLQWTMTWTKCQRTYWMSVIKRPWFPYHPSGSEASLLFFQLLGKICNVSESEVQILVSAAGSDFAQGGWTVWSLDSLIKEWQSLKIHACPLLDVHRQSSAAHLPQHIPDSVCITMACLAKCMWRNLLNICWPAERLMKWVFRQPQNRGLTIAFLDIQLCVCVCAFVSVFWYSSHYFKR